MDLKNMYINHLNGHAIYFGYYIKVYYTLFTSNKKRENYFISFDSIRLVCVWTWNIQKFDCKKGSKIGFVIKLANKWAWSTFSLNEIYTLPLRNNIFDAELFQICRVHKSWHETIYLSFIQFFLLIFIAPSRLTTM